MWGTRTSTATVSTISQAPFKPNTYHHRRCPMLATTAARLPCSAVFFCSVACCRRKSNVEIHQCLCWRCLERITRTKKHKQTPSMSGEITTNHVCEQKQFGMYHFDQSVQTTRSTPFGWLPWAIHRPWSVLLVGRRRFFGFVAVVFYCIFSAFVVVPVLIVVPFFFLETYDCPGPRILPLRNCCRCCQTTRKRKHTLVVVAFVLRLTWYL